jgi:hypothetical protein
MALTLTSNGSRSMASENRFKFLPMFVYRLSVQCSASVLRPFKYTYLSLPLTASVANERVKSEWTPRGFKRSRSTDCSSYTRSSNTQLLALKTLVGIANLGDFLNGVGAFNGTGKPKWWNTPSPFESWDF